jgi:hypothetical protein
MNQYLAHLFTECQEIVGTFFAEKKICYKLSAYIFLGYNTIFMFQQKAQIILKSLSVKKAPAISLHLVLFKYSIASQKQNKLCF